MNPGGRRVRLKMPDSESEQMADAVKRQFAHRAASMQVNRGGWSDEQWCDDAEELMYALEGAVTSLVNGHPLALIRERKRLLALLRSQAERIEELEELLCWHATPQFEEDHRLSKGGDCWYCAELWPCPTQRAEDALADHTCPPDDREPQPSDGPQYHADHAAWETRQRTADDQRGTE